MPVWLSHMDFRLFPDYYKLFLSETVMVKNYLCLRTSAELCNFLHVNLKFRKEENIHSYCFKYTTLVDVIWTDGKLSAQITLCLISKCFTPLNQPSFTWTFHQAEFRSNLETPLGYWGIAKYVWREEEVSYYSFKLSDYLKGTKILQRQKKEAQKPCLLSKYTTKLWCKPKSIKINSCAN